MNFTFGEIIISLYKIISRHTSSKNFKEKKKIDRKRVANFRQAHLNRNGLREKIHCGCDGYFTRNAKNLRKE